MIFKDIAQGKSYLQKRIDILNALYAERERIIRAIAAEEVYVNHIQSAIYLMDDLPKFTEKTQ